MGGHMTVNGNPKKVGLAPDRLESFYGRDIVSVMQFSRDDLLYIFGVADEMRNIVKRVGATDLLKGYVLGNLFYEPSTRTSSSFIAAMERLGGSVIPIHGVQYSSVSKGESLPDTIRTLQCYADVIVLRHPEIGASAVAARYASKPVISAGMAQASTPRRGCWTFTRSTASWALWMGCTWPWSATSRTAARCTRWRACCACMTPR